MSSKVIIDSIKSLEGEFEAFKKLYESGDFDDEVALSLFQNEIKVSLLQTVAGLYSIVKGYHLTSAYSNFCELRPNNDLRDFYENMVTLNVGVKRMVDQGVDKARDVANMVNFDSGYITEWYKNCKDFSSFYNDILSFSGTAMVMSERLVSKNYNKAYYKNLSKSFASMVNSLNRASLKKACLTDRAENSGAGEAFQAIYDYFMESAVNFNTLIEILKTKCIEETKLKEAMENSTTAEIDKSKIYHGSGLDEKNQVRMKSIREANDLYEMFQMDFMRDLNKEVSMMNRDAYNALITKIEKFLVKFPMPLANNVSLGMAEEAKVQINRFIEMVGDISRQTYNPMVMPSVERQ